MGVRIALLTLALVACSRSRDPRLGAACTVEGHDAWTAPDGGAAPPSCAAPFRCSPYTSTCIVGCTTSDDCRALQSGNHPGTACDNYACTFTCASDDECPFGMSCSSSRHCT